MKTPPLLKTAEILGAMALAFGLSMGGALAGTSNSSFNVSYQGGVDDVGHQTKAGTGTAGYVSLSHNYPTGKRAYFRMAKGSTTYGWTGGLVAGNTAYLYNSAVKGSDVRMDAKMDLNSKGRTLKGKWRSN